MQWDREDSWVGITIFGLLGVNFRPAPDCAYSVLDNKEDGLMNIFAASKGMFPMMTSLKPPLKESLN